MNTNMGDEANAGSFQNGGLLFGVAMVRILMPLIRETRDWWKCSHDSTKIVLVLQSQSMVVRRTSDSGRFDSCFKLASDFRSLRVS